MEMGPQAKASFCWYCKKTFSVDVTYRHHLAEFHKMAQETIEEITLSGDVNRGSRNPEDPMQEGSGEETSSETKRRSEPPETHDSDVEIMPGVHQSLRNDASSSESEMAEDVKPTGLNLHEALDTDARRFDEWLQGTCKYRCAICQKIFNTSIRFWNHIDTGHNIHFMRYREEHPEEHCVEKNKIECGLCQGKRVEHDRGKLLRHFRKFHPGQDIKEYYLNHVEQRGGVEEMVVEPDLQMPVAESESESSQNQSGLKRKLEAATEDQSSRPRMDTTPGTQQSPVPSTSGSRAGPPETQQFPVPSTSGSRAGEAEPRVLGELNDNNNVSGLTERQKSLGLSPTKAHKNGVTHDYDAGGIDPLSCCEYTCQFCSVIFKTSWHVFKEHLKKHTLDWDKPPYSYTRATLMSKKEYHECVLCGKTLQADVMYVSNHLHDKHNKMTVKDYRKMNGLWKESR